MSLSYDLILSLKKDYNNVNLFNNNDFNKILKIINNDINKNKSTTINNNWRNNKPHYLKKNNESNEKLLENEINNNLNKLSPKNFDEITKNIINIIIKNNNDTTIKYTIENLFLKATTQPTYCLYYVKLLEHMKENKINIIDNINKKCLEFTDIVKNTNNNDNDNKESNYENLCNLLKQKKLKEGYSQFISELFNNNFINVKTIENILNTFIENINNDIEKSINEIIEDNLICICKLFNVINDITYLKEVFNSKLEYIKNYNKLPKRLKFMLMDIIN